MNKHLFFLTTTLLGLSSGTTHAETIVGNDLNSAAGANAEINQLYSGNRGSNGGGDQSLQFGDHLSGTPDADVLVGGLGIDVLFGQAGNDVLIGGTEDFNPLNRDRAFGQQGDDVFIWAPGDGNDFFDGGEGVDVLVMGILGENADSDGNTAGAPFFNVNPPGNPGSQDFDGIFIDPNSFLPVVNVLGPGFCETLDSSTEGLSDLNIDHLVRFILRGPANAQEQALTADPNLDPDTLDSGLRIAVHLSNTEFLVCASRDGTEVEVFDLTQSPIAQVTINELPNTAFQLISQ